MDFATALFSEWGVGMKKTTYYIGLDVGTSGCKASVVDAKGNVLVTARREYHFEYPGKGMVELNPNTVWACVKETLCEIGKSGYEVRKMSVSSIGEAMVMIDDQDRVIRNGITYLDERGPETVDYICSKISGEEMKKITGLPPRLFYSLNRLVWMQEHEKESLERAKYYFLFGDYITYQLTGARMIDTSAASKTWMLDTSTLDWSKRIGETFGVPLDRFPKVVATGTNAGSIRPEIAQETGLPEELEVLVGCHDQCAAALGAGCVGRGYMVAGEGSTESLNLIVGKEDITEKFYQSDICLEPYVIPGTYMIPIGQHSHGTSIRWFVKELWTDLKESDGKSVYELANEQCAADAGEIYFLPYLSRANLMDPENRSLGLFIGIEHESNRQKMYRALLEGLCYETRFCFDILDETGFPVERITAAGGCSKSELFMQMKADVLQKNIAILENADAGIAALAMICAVADGVYESYRDAEEVFVRTKREYTPKSNYTEKYEKFLLVREAAKQLYKVI